MYSDYAPIWCMIRKKICPVLNCATELGETGSNMNTLVIGNGFDLAHGLPTQYKDFLAYLQMAKYVSNNYEMRYNLNNGTGSLLPLTKFCLDQHMNNVLVHNFCFWIENIIKQDVEVGICAAITKEMERNFWINYFFEKYTKSGFKGDRWVDFEAEIATVVRKIEGMNKTESVKRGIQLDGEKLSNPKLLCDFMTRDNQENKFHGQTAFLKRLRDDMNTFSIFLERYLMFVDDIPIDNELEDIKNIKNINRVINFNYTDTYRRVYLPNMPEGFVDFVHGKATFNDNDEESHIVLGTEETFEDSELANTNLECIYFKKYCQRIYKRTGLKYKEFLPPRTTKQSQSAERTAYFFGHSLSVNDGDIIKYVVDNNDRSVFFYHDEKQHMQLIANLVKILGKDVVIEKANKQFEFRLQKI